MQFLKSYFSCCMSIASSINVEQVPPGSAGPLVDFFIETYEKFGSPSFFSLQLFFNFFNGFMLYRKCCKAPLRFCVKNVLSKE